MTDAVHDSTTARQPPGQRIAVIGAGIAGLASAYLLNRRHAVTLFENAAYLGGHTNTVDVTLDGQTGPVDTGFLVFNDRTYPNLIALFDELGVASHASDMSFGVTLDNGRFEWAGTNIDTVFAQRSNLLSPRFIGMLRDILCFNAAAQVNLAAAEASGNTLGQLLDAGNYSQAFREGYLLPMAAAIWSSAPGDILRFPAATFLRFCLNHALLQVNNRPQWRSVVGGGREYVRRIAATLPDIRLQAGVAAVARDVDGVVVHSTNGAERFDAVVFATHAPTTLALLQDADEREANMLGAVRYQPNTAVLHADTRFLPRRRKVWSAWNYLGGAVIDGQRPVCVSYLINALQQLPFTSPVIVTLNPYSEPDPARVFARFNYEHPLLDHAAIAAQQQLPALQGRNRAWFAGAWTGYGFHEDGLKSALRVAADFDVLPAWARS
ncbi:tRNA 5-methylaminomethyl-2-thiouridine biosynthesis bifunctional protein MnmC [Andreprevotia sp. IGB-42]|uniref:NAD(P)/FAD-dependent oxidoreductase n=1 Tax=Andreprevotia sp. IGB-42 TaxID=2497473 RepID=UPI00157F2E9F|nr:FAD-dependent oxidoreductase [Andreprevotia sp. IGB-42]KAF0813067.1 tRNA 5-methylaminomethyl-2-thiouridine biosynthesis bifunctional protein MnmC [Andreprevotia sp. IGB-42]